MSGWSGTTSALDVGCGPGGNGAWLGEHAFAAGLDVDAVALAYVAGRHAGLTPVQASATELPIASDSVDVAQILTDQPAYARFVRDACPRARQWAAECVSIPCFPDLTDAEVDAVVAELATCPA